MKNIPLSKAELVSNVGAGAHYDYLFFWGHQKSKDGSMTKACFSQWWPSSFVEDELRFPTAEHYMMYRKALLFEDGASAKEILAAPSPKEAKMLGRKVRGYDDNKWLTKRDDIVYQGNLLKFRQNPELSSFLLSTGESVLVEPSPVDAIWGIGMAEDSPDARAPEKWPGLNLLGFCLVRVREKLATEK